ncbi:MAG: sugar phosphate isomerase/epimerase [Chloroflexi bacterium]|nr:sugar phosphate isomerase/epimerase [Chloroflexota bacterium]
MYKALSPGTIGVRPHDLRDAVALAAKHGFGGVEVNAREVAHLVEQEGAEAVRGIFTQAGIRPAGFGLPVDWRGAGETWREGVEQLPRLAAAAASIGATRCMTWVLPSSDGRPYDENRRFHLERFTPIARILAEHGCRLGLEFLGPKTLRDSRQHPFIYKMQDMLALGQEIGPNVGLLLDSWHWYTSGATVDELRALRPEQVVYVHVNDAPAGIPVDGQIDNVRAMPGETGVIDIAGFLRALDAIGYDGPITPEPFKKELRDLPSDDARLQATAAALDSIFRRAGLP